MKRANAGKVRDALRRTLAAVAVLSLILAPTAQAARTPLKPGWNIFSPQQDVQIGQSVSRDAERQLPMLNEPRVDNYLNDLGRRLAAKAPGERFPYRFKAVNDRAINAFALPGGFIYIHRGIIEAADNESQLAGVIAHEIGHVALRHGTNQATKATFAQGALAILGGLVGGTPAALATQLGAQFVASGVLLKYSRSAERDADLLGTQILYDSNYDPRAIVQFFEKIEAQSKSKGGRPPEFFSSHPNPENRAERVNLEIDKLGGAPRGYKTDSAEFREIKRYVLSLPPPPRGGQPRRSGESGRGGLPPRPSDRFETFENSALRMSYPDNWHANAQGSAVSFFPENGVVDDGRGNPALAYGMIVNLFEPHADRHGQITLESATDQLIEELRRTNPRMRIFRQHERIRLAGQRALSTFLINDSPSGGQEYDWLVTLMHSEGVLFFVGVAPERDFDEYERVFQAMLDSLRFR